VQGVRFHGMEECRPCYWMDQAIAPGAHEFLKGRGGLRAKILCDGQLRSNAQLPRMTADQHSIASPFPRERVGCGCYRTSHSVGNSSPQSSPLHEEERRTLCTSRLTI